MLHRIDHADRAAKLGRDPDLGSVVPEHGTTRPRIDQHACHHLARRVVEEMRHVGGLGRVDDRLAVRANRHALGLDAGRYLRDHLARGHVDHRHHVVVLVRHIERIAGDVQGEGFGIGARRQIADDAQRLRVDDLDRVVVARADQDRVAVRGHRYAARALADRYGLHGLHLIEIDNADGVVPLVRHIGHVCAGRIRRRQQEQCGQEQCRLHCNRHLVSGRSMPRVSSAVTWCRKPGCGETDTTPRPSDSRIGWRSCQSHARSVSFCPL